MSATREANEKASGAGQNLPTPAAVSDSSRPVARDRKESAPVAEHALASTIAVPEHAATLTAHEPASEPAAHAAEALSSTSPAEAVHRAIESSTVGLERMHASSVSMVLKPDANTQLALHVKWQQGRFEALAVLERGDFSALGAHWSQLQNRLAEQGIRLAPLVSTPNDTPTFSSGQFSSPNQQRDSASNQQREPVLVSEASLRNLIQPKTLKSTPRPVAVASGREWWA